jgi:putative ABC transport system permease protein
MKFIPPLTTVRTGAKDSPPSRPNALVGALLRPLANAIARVFAPLDPVTKYFKLIWAGLWRKPVRTILTMLSIVVAFLLFGMLQGVNQGINSQLANNNGNRLWSINRMSQVQSIPIGYLQQIKAVPGVREVTHLSFFGGYFQEAKNSVGAFATNVDAFASVYPELNITPEMVQAMQTTRTGALIGKPLADRFGWKVGDRVPLGTTIWTNKDGSNTYQFDIVGVFDADPELRSSPLGSGFWFNYDYFTEARAFGAGTVHQYISAIDDARKAGEVSKTIDKLFANSQDELRTQTEAASLQAQLKQLADINFIVNAIVGAVLFTLLFLTANTMMQSVRERIPELAVLRTLGFSSRSMLILVLVEAFVLCAFAAMLGLFLGAGGLQAVGGMIGITAMPPVVIGIGILVAALLALVSGLPPALRAQRLNIVDALAGR